MYIFHRYRNKPKHFPLFIAGDVSSLLIHLHVHELVCDKVSFRLRAGIIMRNTCSERTQPILSTIVIPKSSNKWHAIYMEHYE